MRFTLFFIMFKSMACLQATSARGATVRAGNIARVPRRLSLHPIALAGLTGVLWALPGGLQAQTTAPFQTVTTVASREPLAADQQVADVVVITRQELQSLPVDNLADALQRLTGVQVSRTGGAGQPTSVLMRGAAASGTLVLVDGVRMGSATVGQFDFATLGLAGIERIEVLRGPGATVHGADAVAGVVLVTTRQAGAPSGVAATVGAGQLGAQETSLRGRRTGGGWDVQMSASREAGRGTSAVRPGDRFGLFNPDADGFQRQSLQLGGGWTVAPGHRFDATVHASRLFSRYDSAVFLPPTFAPDASPDFATRTGTAASQLRYAGQSGRSWSWQAHVGRGQEDSRSGAITLDRFQTDRDQAGLQVSWQPVGGHRWTLAWDHLGETVRADSYPQTVSRRNDALTLSYGGRVGPLQLQADARQDRNSVYGSQETGRAGLRWSLSPQTDLRLQAATSFRAPSFNELFFPAFGVPTLSPEEGRSLEAGVSHLIEGLRWSVSAWRQSIRNLIAFSGDRARCPAGTAFDFGCAANFGEAALRGLTVEIAPQRSAGAWGSWRLGYDHTDARDGEGKPLPRRARHQLRVQAEMALSGWRVGPSWLWQSERQEGGVALRGGSRLDFQATRPLGPAWTLQMRLLNALNADIEPARDYRAPGRQAWVGLRWEG